MLRSFKKLVDFGGFDYLKTCGGSKEGCAGGLFSFIVSASTQDDINWNMKGLLLLMQLIDS